LPLGNTSPPLEYRFARIVSWLAAIPLTINIAAIVRRTALHPTDSERFRIVFSLGTSVSQRSEF
jgi:hypothetical protein